MRLWGHWDALRGGDALPSRTRFTAAAGSDLRQNGFTIEIADGTGEPVFRFVGKEVIEEYGQDPTGRPVGDVPAQSVLGWVAKNLADVMANKSPIGCEDKTVVGDYQINLRGVLLPFSEDRQRIDYIVGAVTFKKMLAETTFDDPVAEPPTDTESIAAEEPAEPVEAPAATDEAVPSRALSEHLDRCKELAQAADIADSRSRASLYRALEEAYAFHLEAEAAGAAYGALLERAEIAVQERAPFTPVIKLIFGKDHDRTRLSEYAAALSFAKRQDRSKADIKEFFQSQDGGLKGCVRAERAARRAEATGGTTGGAMGVDSGGHSGALDWAREAMRRQPTIGEAIDAARGEPEFVILLGRRSKARPGLVQVVQVLAESQATVDQIVKRAAKALAADGVDPMQQNPPNPPIAISEELKTRTDLSGKL